MHVDPLDVIAKIGGIPIGDPVAMTDHAARLRADADHLMSLALTANARAGIPYEGPAADRFRHDMDVHFGDAVVAHDRLYDASYALDRAAASVASTQAQWRRRFAEVEHDLAQAAAHLAGG